MPTTVRGEKWKKSFEDTYGVGNWKKFKDLVYAKTRPNAIQEEFPSPSGGPMSKPTYYKWEARAWEVKP
jgi:hypothetical protein